MRADLLSAQSLLLAILAALFALWNEEFNRAAESVPQGKIYNDNKTAHRRIKHALFFRALPLTLYSFALATVMAPVTWWNLVQSWRLLCDPAAAAVFDPIAATLVLVHLGIVSLALYSATVVRRIWKTHSAFEALPRT
jgi:hypothetical protein